MWGKFLPAHPNSRSTRVLVPRPTHNISPPSTVSTPKVAALLCAALAAGVYVLTAGPSLYWLDSSEFVAAAWTLGIAHPPGHPLAALLGRLACYLPFGTIAFRVTMASALAAAAAVGLLALISHELTQRTMGEETGRSTLLPACVATLTAAFSYAVWFQAVRAEVYTLHLVLVLAAVHLMLCWQRTSDGRFVLGAGLFVGLALCNHHLLVVLALPGGVLLWLLHRSASVGHKRLGVGLVATALLGLTVLTYLPLRATQLPRVNWGVPNSVERFAWVVSAKAFQRKSVQRAARETLEHRSKGAFFAMLGGPPSGMGPLVVGAVAGFLGLAGLYLASRRRSSRRAAIPLAVLIALNLLGPMMVGFDPFNPDAHGYLCLAVALLAPGIAVFVQALLHLLRSAGRTALALGVVAAVALPVCQLWTNLPRNDLAGHWATEETSRELLSQPPGALLLTSYFQTVFDAWAMRSAFDLRPDVDLVHRNFSAQPGYLHSVAQRTPRLRSWVERWNRSGEISLDDLRELARTRHVALEYDLNVSKTLASRLRPAGLALAFSDESVTHGQSLRHGRRIRRWINHLGNADDLETRRALTWTHYLLATYACGRGLSDTARLHLGLAQHLAPHSRHIGRLAERCLYGNPIGDH